MSTAHAIHRAVTVSVLAAGCISAAAAPGPRTVSGTTAGGIGWTATSTVVATGSTATLVGGGDRAYTVGPPYNAGVVELSVGYGGGRYTCTGALLPDRRSILTAAHCVTDDKMRRPTSTVAHFYGGTDPDTRVALSPLSTAVAVERFRVHADYTGMVIDQNDIAVLRLAEAAPDFAPSFELYTDDLAGKDFTVMGYGLRSAEGGRIGSHLDTGRLRQGQNRYDFRMGDDVFGGAWATLTGREASQIEHTWMADFDSGLAENDLACRSVQGEFDLGPDARWCDLGRGMMEATIAPGDSGGPSFIDGRIASVSSFGLSFDTSVYGDVDDMLNSSFGEFGGYVPVYLHEDFIKAALVPEPGTWALGTAGLFAVLGVVSRRRRTAARI